MALYDENDVATLVRARELSDAMMRELATTLPRPIEVPPDAYETTRTAPLVAPIARPAPPLPRKKGPKRSHAHWAVLAMALAIGLGLWRDSAARTNAKRQLVTETTRIVKRVSARVI